MRVEAAIVVCTKWATLTAPRLDHTEPITLADHGITIRIDPLRVVDRNGKDIWQLPMDVRRSLGPDADKISRVRDEMHFVTADGKKLPRTGAGGSHKSANQEETRVRIAINAFDPATTSLVIREPAAIEIVPIELVFRNVPMIDRDVP